MWGLWESTSTEYSKNIIRFRKVADLGGVGLGLAIVQRLGKLLDHHVDVRSVPGKGSGFSIEVPLADKSAIAEDRSQSVTVTPLTHHSSAIFFSSKMKVMCVVRSIASCERKD